MDTLKHRSLIGNPLIRVAPPRRRRWWLIAAALVVVVGLGTAGGIFATNYQPLTSSAFGGDPGAFRSLGRFMSPHGESFTAYRVTYHDRQLTSYVFDLINRGPLPVTVTGIGGASGNEKTLMAMTGVFMAVRNDLCCNPKPAQLVPFQAFNLPPNHQRLIQVRARFTGCERWTPGTSSTYSLQHVHFRALGIPRNAWVDVHATYQVVAPAPPGCPERTMSP